MFTNKADNGRNNICGIQIAKYRKSLGKSQRELADALQILGLDVDKMPSSVLKLVNDL